VSGPTHYAHISRLHIQEDFA